MPTQAPTASPTATPTGAVLEITSPPTPSPSPSPAPPAAAPVVPAPPAAPCPDGSADPLLSAFAIAVPCPGLLDLDPAVVATNLGLTAAFVLLFGLTSEIFNSTIDENRRKIGSMWTRMTVGPARLLTPLAVATARLENMSTAGPLGAFGHAVVVLGFVGLIYGFLARDFAPDAKGIILIVSMVVGIGLITYVSEGTRTLIARRRFHANATVRLYGTAVAAAIVAVAVSRVMGLAPGIVYGFVASSLILTPVALAKRDQAILVVLPFIALLAVTIGAFVLLGEASRSATMEGVGPSLEDAILAVVFVAGLEGLVFTMLPLRFMHGSTVMRWSKPAWAILFGGAVFLWWQLLLNRDEAYIDAFKQVSVRLVIGALVLFMGTTAAIWLYFRYRDRGEEAEGEDGGTSGGEAGEAEAVRA